MLRSLLSLRETFDFYPTSSRGLSTLWWIYMYPHTGVDVPHQDKDSHVFKNDNHKSKKSAAFPCHLLTWPTTLVADEGYGLSHKPP